jgi:hypothetical protein
LSTLDRLLENPNRLVLVCRHVAGALARDARDVTGGRSCFHKKEPSQPASS